MKGINQAVIRSLFFSLALLVSGLALAQDGAVGIDTEQVNINHADAETIALVLDGVGLRRAEAIVSYREEFGEFTSVDDLLLVSGIGEITLENNRAKISLD